MAKRPTTNFPSVTFLNLGISLKNFLSFRFWSSSHKAVKFQGHAYYQSHILEPKSHYFLVNILQNWSYKIDHLSKKCWSYQTLTTWPNYGDIFKVFLLEGNLEQPVLLASPKLQLCLLKQPFKAAKKIKN